MKHKKTALALSTVTLTGVVATALEKKIIDALFARDDKIIGEDREGKLYEYEWFDAHDPKSVYLIAKDKVQLHAHYFAQPKNNHNYMILFHGFHGYVKELSYEAKHFYELGYNLLMPNMRAHGMSGGAMITMGILEHQDACEWIRYLLNMDPKAKISLYGVSMGGATTLMTLAKAEGAYIKAAISDCAYSRAIDVFDFYLSKHLRVPYRWYLYASNDFIYRRTHISLRESKPIDTVDQITTPVLFIHGEEDDLVPYSMLEELYKKATCPKEKLSIPHAKHALASSQDPETYWAHVDAFLAKYHS